MTICLIPYTCVPKERKKWWFPQFGKEKGRIKKKSRGKLKALIFGGKSISLTFYFVEIFNESFENLGFLQI